ncbi:type IVa secretion system protein IcmB [Shewanella inventionis]|uniref:Type IVa secretion system protein IcmB n=1 Tax=Shewanella inventionis TaxID=1738770 RepID=A0ABQ1JHH1_9GAMM|nr:ATP-binding protein [Shewanella inventionis]GGB66129.1 type IVa secretion system protein IcmB [Shewanella inventionis]
MIVDKLFKMLSSLKKEHAFNYLDLCHNTESNTLVTDSGALVTVFKINGLQAIPGEEEWINAANNLLSALQTIFKSDGLTVQWVYEKDDNQTQRELIRHTRPAIDAMNAIGLDLKDIYQENIKVNREWVCFESSHIAIWSDFRLIEPQLLKKRINENASKAVDIDLFLSDVPNIFLSISELIVKHKSVVEEFLYNLGRAKILAQTLTSEEACRVIKVQYDKEASPNWVAQLIGQLRYIKAPKDGEPNDDGSELFWTKLNEQIANKPFEYKNGGQLCIGQTLYKSGMIETFPITVKPFRSLVESIDGNLPFRISFKIMSGKGFDWSLRQNLLAFTSFLSSDNSRVQSEMSHLEKLSETDPFVRMSVSFSTWSNEPETLMYNYSRLDQAVQGWGVSQTLEDKSDEMELYTDTVIAANAKTCATQTYIPISECIKFLPIDRTANIWDKGFLLFRTLQGVCFPWTPISPLLKPSIELYIARSRQGKSVLSNSILAALTLSPGNKVLPLAATIDVGPSSIGIHKMIRDRLPESEKHKVITYVLSLDGDDYINPFEKNPCLDSLFMHQRAFVAGFLLLLSQNSRGEMHENMEGYVDALIEEVYQYKANEGATAYNAGILPEVDRWIAENDFTLYEDTKWIEIEKALGDANEWKMAQECCVKSSPILNDFVTVANQSGSLLRMYGDSNDPSSPKKEFVLRMTESAKKYPIFTSHSTLNFRAARLRSIDLQNVITKDEIIGPRQNGIMFMLALYLGSGDFFMNSDCLRAVDSRYLDHYKQVVKEVRSSPCRLFMDEFHQCSGLRQTVVNVERYMREGGKWGINSALASQEAGDFTPTMIRQATSYFFLGGNSVEAVKALQDQFSLSHSDFTVLTDNTVHGPKKGGSSLLYVYKTNEGQFSQVLKFPVGPQMLWANSSNPDDLIIKEEINAKIGSNIGLSLLGEMYSGGTAESEIQRRRSDESVVSKDIVKDIIDEILTVAGKRGIPFLS